MKDFTQQIDNKINDNIDFLNEAFERSYTERRAFRVAQQKLIDELAEELNVSEGDKFMFKAKFEDRLTELDWCHV